MSRLGFVRLYERRRRVLRIVGMFVAATSVTMVLLVSFFIARTEMAHDEAKCPFRAVSAQSIATGVTVAEQGRRCIAELEERRWLVRRTGKGEVEIGRRRLRAPGFSHGAYSWHAEIEHDRKVAVHVDFRGGANRPSIYRELQ